MIDEIKRAQILDLIKLGHSVDEICVSMKVGRSTVYNIVNRYKGAENEKPAPTESTADAGIGGTTTTNNDNTTEQVKKSTRSSATDKIKGKYFTFLVYPTKEQYEEYYNEHRQDYDKNGEIRPHYEGESGYGTPPDDWIDQIEKTGLAFTVSPLHDRDMTKVRVDGKTRMVLKKPHYHVLVTYGNTTTMRNVTMLTDSINSPAPQKVENVKGAYNYLTHKDDPQKYQYEEEPTKYNGWEIPVSDKEEMDILRDVRDMIIINDIREYIVLTMYCDEKGPEYSRAVKNNVMYCSKLCDGYRYNAVSSIRKFLDHVTDPELRDKLEDRIKLINESKPKDFKPTPKTEERVDPLDQFKQGIGGEDESNTDTLVNERVETGDE